MHIQRVHIKRTIYFYPGHSPPGEALQGLTLKDAGKTSDCSAFVAYKCYADVYRGDALTEGNSVAARLPGELIVPLGESTRL